VDLRAVKTATGPELATAAAATSRNACDLLRDAELLAGVHSTARAYCLAALAVEEVGKAACLASLAGMPEGLKARAQVGRMLGWHQLKQATGQLIAAVPFGPPGLGARLLAMPASDLQGGRPNVAGGRPSWPRVRRSARLVIAGAAAGRVAWLRRQNGDIWSRTRWPASIIAAALGTSSRTSSGMSAAS
jgi:AbiV